MIGAPVPTIHAYLREYFRNFPGSRSNEISLLNIGFNFGNSSLSPGLPKLPQPSIFTFRSILRHGILCLGSFLCCNTCVLLAVTSSSFCAGITPLFVEILDALIWFHGNGYACLSFLPHFIGCLNLFLTCTFDCFCVLCLSGSFGGTCACSIFATTSGASKMASVSPAFTLCPSFTRNSSIRPGTLLETRYW